MDLQSLTKPNKNIALIGIVFFVFAASLIIGVISSQKNKNAATPQTGDEALKGTTQLIIEPQIPNLGKGESTSVAVKLTGTPSQAIDIIISYNPAVIKLSNIAAGDVFPDILRSNISENTLSVSAAVDPSNPTDLKTGTLFTFDIEGVDAGTSPLEFDKTMTITAKNGVNTLGTAEAVSISVR